MTTEPRERPILFQDEMVRLILSGKKTQTRRLTNPQPAVVEQRNGDKVRCSPVCPYGQPGDMLWVRHKHWYAKTASHDPLIWDEITLKRRWTKYNADENQPLKLGGMILDEEEHGSDWRKRPGMFLPRWAALLTIQIEAVRMERLQEITEADASAEGFGGLDKPREAFAHVWDLINGQRGATWESNPWVWVITFRMAQDLSKEAQP